MKEAYYVIIIYQDIEPELIGPFPTVEARDEKARELKRQYGNEHGIFPMNIDAEGKPAVGAYSCGFFMDDEEIEAMEAAYRLAVLG
jgi:hypothetical protein